MNARTIIGCSLLCSPYLYAIDNEYKKFASTPTSELYGGIADYQIKLSEKDLLLPKDLDETKQNIAGWNQILKLTNRYIEEHGTNREKQIIKRLDIINAKFMDSINLFHNILANPSTALILNDDRVLKDIRSKWLEYLSELKNISAEAKQRLDEEIPFPPQQAKLFLSQEIKNILPNFDLIIKNYKKFKNEDITKQAFLNSLPAKTAFERDDLIDNLRKIAFIKQHRPEGFRGKAKKLIFNQNDKDNLTLTNQIIGLLRTEYPSTTPLDTQKFGAAKEDYKSLVLLTGISGILEAAIAIAHKAAPDIIKQVQAKKASGKEEIEAEEKAEIPFETTQQKATEKELEQLMAYIEKELEKIKDESAKRELEKLMASIEVELEKIKAESKRKAAKELKMGVEKTQEALEKLKKVAAEATK